MTKKFWNILSDRNSDKDAVLELSKGLSITELTARLLVNRGIKDKKSADAFFSFADTVLHDPYLLRDMDKAVKRLEKAIEINERTVVYGDYDVDGITSTALIYKYLKKRGIKDLSFYIPERVDEGYGLNNEAIDKLASEGVTLIVTVDTGVTAVNEVEYARSLGIDVLITDHHECPEQLPDAVAVVNPKRSDMDKDEQYPFQYLAGVGVAFKLVCALEISRLGRDSDYLTDVTKEYCDLIAAGTIADIMPVLDENRLFVRMGLYKLNNMTGTGWKALRNRISGESNVQKKEISKFTSSFISFSVAPRLNAAGRMDRADKAVELLLAESESEALEIADYLCEMNLKRQAEENRILEEAVGIIERDGLDKNPIIIVDSEGWSSGVIGIVSSRITERYAKPSILISMTDNSGKGSGRSVNGINLVDALNACSNLLDKFGGHELAAGLSVKAENISEFKKKMCEYVGKSSEGVDLTSVINVECEVEPNELNLNQVKELAMLEPYGTGNQHPIFLLRNCTVSDITEVGYKHTKITVAKGIYNFTVLFFGIKRELLDVVKNDCIDIVFQLSLNEFRGETFIQLIGKDFCVCRESFSDEDRRLSALLPGIEADCGENVTRDMIPTRDDFARIYIYIKRRPGLFISHRELSAIDGSNVSLFKISAVLYVLEEAGLINVTAGSVKNGIAVYEASTVRSKIDLMSMPLIKRLNSICKHA